MDMIHFSMNYTISPLYPYMRKWRKIQPSDIKNSMENFETKIDEG